MAKLSATTLARIAQRATQHLSAAFLGRLGVGGVQVGRGLLLAQYSLQRCVGRLTIRVSLLNSLQAPPLLVQFSPGSSQPEPGTHHQRTRLAEPAGDEAGGEGAEVVDHVLSRLFIARQTD
jgi:hypothetical protein